MAVVDVPVVIQHKFQQSFVDFFKVPQLQFIDRVLVFPVMPQSLVRTVETVQKVGDSTAQFLGRQLTRPLFFNDSAGLVSASAVNSGGSAVAVLPRWSMSLLLQFIDKV